MRKNTPRIIKDLVDDNLYVQTLKLRGKQLKSLDKKRGKKSLHAYLLHKILG
jgi:hypothetical protein